MSASGGVPVPAPAPEGSSPAAVSASAASNISTMQLFHELKQQFPAVPDRVVSGAISAHRHDRSACRRWLEREAEALANRPYPAASIAGRRSSQTSQTSHTSHTSDEPPEPPQPERPPRRPDSLRLAVEPRPRLQFPQPQPQHYRQPNQSNQLNVSFDVRCTMDDASVNVTVRTPTSTRRAPPTVAADGYGYGYGYEGYDGYEGFEGNVRITVGRRDSPGDGLPDATLRKQRLRLERLESALKADRARLASARREVNALRSPPPSPRLVDDLRRSVLRLHALCQSLAERLDRASAESGGERCGPSLRGEDDRLSWKCHICTFENRPGLNECEMCGMPRIILVHTDDEVTVQLHPGITKVGRTWIL